ncbi:MAG: ABC transporter permease [Aquisalinus sp.]|nr:ABC transporter permease [Aquisalinus sp.]
MALDETTDAGKAIMSSDKLMPWLKRAPLLPEAGAAGTPLVAVIMVICFLASLALAGFFAVSEAANDWTSDLRGSVTVQIKGQDAITIASDTGKAMEFLRDTDGVISARALSREETVGLLQPWLGTSNLPASLPVPGLIEMEVTPALRQQLGDLAANLSVAAPGATIDDHSTWNDSLAASARTVQIFSFGVFALIMGAVCVVIIFATKAGLAANKEIVDVLHLVGATDRYIALEVQRRFLVLGLRGAMAGVVLAAVCILVLVMAFGSGIGAGYFLPDLSGGGGLFFYLLSVPLMTCLVAAWTARTTVLRTLAKRF